MYSTVEHAGWCDGFHVEIGSPVCSMVVDEDLGVMMFDDGDRVEVVVMLRPVDQLV